MQDFTTLSNEELKEIHAAIHKEITRRDVNAVLQDLNAKRPVPKIFKYKLRAYDRGTNKYVIWDSLNVSIEEASGVGPFDDLTILSETEVNGLASIEGKHD